uniref:Uncharacterized protein n=1 Tax=Trichobilharzia regenti TaxID=157069 RepID=A0AA85IUP0_TRIRE
MNSTEMNNMFGQIFKYGASYVMKNGYISNRYSDIALVLMVMCLLLLILLSVNNQCKFLPQPFAFVLITLMVVLWLIAYSLLCSNHNLVELNTYLGVSIAVHTIVGFVATYVGKLSVSYCVKLLKVATVAFICGAVFSVLNNITFVFDCLTGICWGVTSDI